MPNSCITPFTSVSHRNVQKHAHLPAFYTWMLSLSTPGCIELFHANKEKPGKGETQYQFEVSAFTGLFTIGLTAL